MFFTGPLTDGLQYLELSYQQSRNDLPESYLSSQSHKPFKSESKQSNQKNF